MNANVVHVAVVDGKTITQTVELSYVQNGQPVRIKAVQGGKYILAQGVNGVAPENITIKRVGKDLHIALEGSDPDQPQLIIEDFEGSGGQLVGVAEDGSYHEYISSDAEQDRSAAFLIEGVEAPQVLGAQPLVGFGDGLAAAAGIGWFWPALLGLAALGVLGGVYAATRDDGGNDDVPGGGSGNTDKGSVGGVDDNVGDKQGLIENGGSTDDRTPTFTGEGRPGTSVEIIDNGKTIGTAIVGEDGKWEYTPPVPGLDDGKHDIVIVPVDKDGNKGEPSPGYEIIVDTMAPSRPLIDGLYDDVAPQEGQIGSGGHTNDTTPTLSGTAEADAIIHIYDNGVEIGTALADADGKWSFTPDPALTEGPHEFTVTAEDAAGNISPPSLPFPIIVDLTLPGKPGVGTGGIDDVLDNVGPDQGSVGDGDSTDDTTPTLVGGGAEPGDTVIIIDNGLEIGTAIVGNDGKWEFTPDPELIEGSHEIVVVIKDPAGNESEPSDPHTIIVDTTAPGKPGVGTGGIDDVLDNVGPNQGSIGDGDSTDDTTPTLIGSGAEPGDTVTIIDNGVEIGTAVVGADGKWEFTPDPVLTDGTHEIVVVITDPAGNESEPSDPYTIIVDTSAPVAPTLDSVVDDQGTVTGNLVSGQITDDARPDLSGTAEPGSLVTIYDNGVPIGSVVATNGNWTFTPTLPLLNGPHTLTVTATDAAGNESAPTPGFDLDVIAGGTPVAPAIITVVDDQGSLQGPVAQNQSTDDAQPTINGTGASGSTITVFANGLPLGTAIVDANGQWSFTPTTPLADGLNNLTAQATDAAGNQSPTTGNYPINVDTLAPGAPVSQSLTDDVGAMTGTINAGDITDDANPTFSGTAEPGSVVVIYDGINPIGSVTTDPITGAWSFTPAAALVDGLHSFSAQAVDSAGNIGPMGPVIPFTVDTSTVVISITSVVDNAGSITGNLTSGQTTDDTTPTLNGQATPGGIVSIYDGATLLGTVIADASGQWTFTTQVLATGSHDLTATVTTAAGGESAPTAVFQTIIDTTAPGVPVIGNVADDVGTVQGTIADGGSTDDTTPTLSGDGLQPGDTVQVYDGNVLIGASTVLADGTWSYTPTTPRNDGVHEFTIVTVDPAGNTSTPSAPYTVIIDTSAPAAPTLDAVVDDQGAVTGNLISGQVTDDARPDLSGTAEPGSLVTIYDNGVPIGSVIATNGSWTFTPTLPLSNGPHTLAVTATDAAGNESAQTPGFDLDVVAGGAPAAPAITSVVDDQGTSQGPIGQNQSTDDAQPTINGTGTSGNVITVFANGVALGTTIVDANGQWSFTPTTPLADGLNNLTAQATDAAGNPSPTTGNYPINVDTVAPGAPVSQVLTDDVGQVTGGINAGDTTDDANPTFSGTAEPGAVVMIYDGVNLIGSATTDLTTGAWSFTPVTALVDGAHSFSAQVVDSAGNVGPMGPVIPFTVDTSAVVISITSVEDNEGSITGNLASGQTTDDTTPTLNGQATPGGIVSIYDGVTLLGTVTADASGQWTFTTPVLATGAHNLTATVTTAAGGESAPTPVFQTIIDTTAPGVPVIGNVADDVGAIQGTIADGGSTDDTTPTLSGGGLQAGDLVEVYDGNNLIGSTTVLADGSWSYTPTTPLNDGIHDFTIVTVDPAGNASAPSASWTVEIDTSAPIASAVVDSMSKDSGADSGDFVTNDGSAGRLIQGSLTAALGVGEKVQVSTDGGATWLDVLMNPDDSWSFIDQSTHSGDWSIQTRVVDAAGQTNITATSVILDTAAPDVPTSVSRVGDDIEVDITGGNAQAGDQVSVMIGDYRFSYELTPGDIGSGRVVIAIPDEILSLLPANTRPAAGIVDNAGNISAYRSDNFFGQENFSFWNAATSEITMDRGYHIDDATLGLGWHVPENFTTTFTFDNPQGYIAVDVGHVHSTGCVVRFLDASGNVLNSQVLQDAPVGVTYIQTYQYLAPAGVTIASVEVVMGDEPGGDGGAMVDNIVWGGGEFTPSVNQVVAEVGGPYYGAASDDVFSVIDTSYFNNADAGIHGGTGVDTLTLSGTGQALDLSMIVGKLESIEILDITGAGNNTLNLSLGDVLEQGETSLFTADDSMQMMVKGNAGDVVNLDDLLLDGTDPGDWATAGTATVAGVTYNVFQHSTLDAQLLIQDGVTTNLV